MRTLPLVVLRSLMRKVNWLRFQGIVDVETFQNMTFRKIYTHLTRLHGATEGDITIESLMSDLEITYQTRAEMLAELTEIVLELQDIEEVEPELLERTVRDFVQRAFATKAAEYVATHMDSQDFSVDVFAGLAARTVEVSGRVDASVTDFFTSPISQSANTRSVRFGLGLSPELDRDLGGGIGVGELAVLLAPPSRGKTSLLCAAGVAAARAGRHVLHISFEIPEEMVTRRWDQAITNLTPSGLDEHPELIVSARAMLQEAGGSLRCKDWSGVNVTANDVESLVRRRRALGEKIELVILDYLELMYPNEAAGKRTEQRHVYGSVAKEVRALGNKLKVPILTAWQVNREGSGEEMLTVKHISESWDVLKHCDTMIGINQNSAMMLTNRMKLNVLKQRQDTSRRAYRLYCDLSRMIVREESVADDLDVGRNIAGELNARAADA